MRRFFGLKQAPYNSTFTVVFEYVQNKKNNNKISLFTVKNFRNILQYTVSIEKNFNC